MLHRMIRGATTENRGRSKGFFALQVSILNLKIFSPGKTNILILNQI